MKNLTKKNLTIYDKSIIASKQVALRIAQIINENNSKSKKTVLGLATGNTPIMVYQELIRLHKTEGLSFKNVITFNLDEYFPMLPSHPLSYANFMDTQLFNHIDINRENIHIPNGNLNQNEIDSYCKAYETKMDQAGGLDFQLLGIGRTGHIGFNEPGSSINSITRLVTLNPITREDAINDFGGINNVPKQAISMGVETIFKAKEIMLLAFSEKKAEIIQKVIEGEITKEVPGSYLQNHPNVTFILDKEAASVLNETVLV
nr:glucosamine-6-phosphate deaminase [uncultured Flavobacterium sp.]